MTSLNRVDWDDRRVADVVANRVRERNAAAFGSPVGETCCGFEAGQERHHLRRGDRGCWNGRNRAAAARGEYGDGQRGQRRSDAHGRRYKTQSKAH